MGYYSGRVVVITGAGAGIGRALAVAVAEQGARLALADLDLTAVQQTRQLCSAAEAVRVDHLDVTDLDAVEAWADAVFAEFGRIDVVLAIAGMIHVGGFIDSSPADMRRVIDVDFWGVVHTARAFLPHLQAVGNGHLALMSSAFGLIGAPSHTAYCAAKAAVRGFAESLRPEVAATGVTVTGLYPGGVRTSIMRTGTYAARTDREAVIARFDQMIARTSAQDAATSILRGVERRRAQVLVGADAWLTSVVVRIFGPAYQRILPFLLRLDRRLSR